MASFEYTYHDEDRQVDYEFMIHDDGENRTFDLLRIVDFSFDPNWGIDMTAGRIGVDTLEAERHIIIWFENIVDKLGLNDELDELNRLEREKDTDRDMDRLVDRVIGK